MRRRLGLGLVFGAAVPLAVASIAWACGVLATLSLDTRVAKPGQVVTVTGKNYGVNGVEDVKIRLKGRNGQVLATTAALPDGRIRTQFPLPDNLDPGWYVVVATQQRNDGTPKSGTPGRTNIRIQGSSNTVVAPVWAGEGPGPSAPQSAPADGGRSPVPLLLALALSLSMLAGGWTLLTRRRAAVDPHFGV